MKLSAYLEQHGTPITVFARRIGVSGATVHNILKKRKDMWLSVALKIEEYTKGQVTCKDLLQEKFHESTKKTKKKLTKKKS